VTAPHPSTQSSAIKDLTLPGPRDWARVERVEREQDPRLIRVVKIATSTVAGEDDVTYTYRTVRRIPPC
jgi:hypothetical protein